jgi:hypothetical protein
MVVALPFPPWQVTNNELSIIIYLILRYLDIPIDIPKYPKLSIFNQHNDDKFKHASDIL